MSGDDFELLNESKAWYELRTSGPDSTVVSPSESPYFFQASNSDGEAYLTTG